MGVFEKLKNVFFEEEYVEVEEPVVKKKPVKEQAVAKKIELPQIKRKKEKEKKEEIKEKVVVDNDLPIEAPIIRDEDIISTTSNDNFKFPMNFGEEDFKQDYSYIKEERRTTKREVKKVEEVKPKVEPEVIKEVEPKDSNFSGLYEGNLEATKKKAFKPTPIISPIYGILDKNYTKDEIVTKKEIRISGSPKNVDLDTVREKAYGDLASDITASMYEDEENEVEKEQEEDNNLLYDLNEDDSPAVTKVTVGDAEEYYNDLGLEYNIDYKDDSKEKATGRRAKKEGKEKEEKTKEKKKEDKSESKDTKVEKEDAAIEDNLFDLIDSMYEDKE